MKRNIENSEKDFLNQIPEKTPNSLWLQNNWNKMLAIVLYAAVTQIYE